MVATEDHTRTPAYLDALHRNGAIQRTRVKIVLVPSTDDRSSPGAVLDRLLSWNEYELRDFDQLWLVLDVDRWKDLETTVRDARRRGVRTAVSNPCVEVWSILHFERVTDATRECGPLKRRLHELTRGSEDAWTPEAVQAALERARRQDDVDSFVPGQGQTQMHLLVEQLATRS